jgi:hypothetical protein
VLRIRDVYPGSRISDPKIATKERGENLLSYLFFVAADFTKLKIIKILTQKFVTKLSKIWVRDPRSGIRKKPTGIPDPGSGSRGQKGIGYRGSGSGSVAERYI